MNKMEKFKFLVDHIYEFTTPLDDCTDEIVNEMFMLKLGWVEVERGSGEEIYAYFWVPVNKENDNELYVDYAKPEFLTKQDLEKEARLIGKGEICKG